MASTKFEELLEQLRQEISRRIGLSESDEMPLEVTYSGMGTALGTLLRIPAPGADWLDYRMYGDTDDILAGGGTVDEAIENVCSAYMAAAKDMAIKGSFAPKRQTISLH